VLLDDGNPVGAGVEWTTERHFLAVEQDRAGVGLVDPTEHLDQRALAGPILTDQRVDLAGIECEVNAAQRLDRAELLGHVTQLDNRLGRFM
jgi:hypothetical protein